jgi:hypothetical protein
VLQLALKTCSDPQPVLTAKRKGGKFKLSP